MRWADFKLSFMNGATVNSLRVTSLIHWIRKCVKMLMLLTLLQDNGHELREPYSKYLSEGIFELRAKAGTDISRVLYFFYVDHRIILTNGFIKKTQKTPAQEMEKAKKYRADYLSRRRASDEQ